MRLHWIEVGPPRMVVEGLELDDVIYFYLDGSWQARTLGSSGPVYVKIQGPPWEKCKGIAELEWFIAHDFYRVFGLFRCERNGS